jgi:hypothetical protein
MQFPAFASQEVFPEAAGEGNGTPAGDDMMLLSFEEFKGIMEDYDVSAFVVGTAAGVAVS